MSKSKCVTFDPKPSFPCLGDQAPLLPVCSRWAYPPHGLCVWVPPAWNIPPAGSCLSLRSSLRCPAVRCTRRQASSLQGTCRNQDLPRESMGAWALEQPRHAFSFFWTGSFLRAGAGLLSLQPHLVARRRHTPTAAALLAPPSP